MIKKIAIVILLLIAAVFVGLLMLGIALPFLLPVLLPLVILFSILVRKKPNEKIVSYRCNVNKTFECRRETLYKYQRIVKSDRET